MNVSNPVHTHAAKIVAEYHRLKSLSELTITAETMMMFHQFLNLLSNEHGSEFADAVLAEPAIQGIKFGIQQLFSQASSLYERHWAERIIASQHPNAVLSEEYPYYLHYQRATALEINAIQALADKPTQQVLMVGSGALPLTSLALANSGFTVDNLDISAADLSLGEQVCGGVAKNQHMRFIHNDILQQTDLRQYDVIWLAALVGDETIKNNILQHLFNHMQAGALLVIRTAFNLRTLLYPSLTEQHIAPFQLKLKIQTYADNFHSILIAQKPKQ
ncbi:nicotianamine synthase family protein [Pseudoalteromonas fenneropenaei]|uniref:Nicotianamine synthase family protein n=1 Tax=Pseudoalteromonas fenneropenaei TaxID=1737459 RepID=A0ABV7CJK4_9GAMM